MGVKEVEDKMLKSTQDRLYDQAARVIQRTWRRHANIVVFKYFKNLITFRNQGDPSLLLKFVNPREADLLDAASGVYMRFRLGGTSFPPNIYYKIFTHRPIVDMCANSPKDYTHVGQKRAVAQQVHNGLPLVPDDRSGWYRRVENNGWRLLSGKICLLGDPITQDTSCKRTDFHHCKLIRRQDAERKKKNRKIEWMRKMYDVGALHTHTEHGDRAVVELVETSAKGMTCALEQLGPDARLDWEVDELIGWTSALDFDEYIKEWNLMGTSKSSMLQKEKQQVLSALDPLQFSQATQDKIV
ncbi:protein MFI [Clarias gariepinus]